jgi:serine O-acetyltransferase
MIIPDIKAVHSTVDRIYSLMFPIGDDIDHEFMAKPQPELVQNMESVLDCLTDKKTDVTREFFSKLPAVRKKLIKDAEYILNSDPAATHLIEVIAIYPGFFAIFCYRIGHLLATMGITFLPRMITEYAHSKTGIDIHPNAVIGTPFSIDHGTGIVIGETAAIGSRVKMYQGVTLGALSVAKSKAARKRHPTIEDNVILYAGSTILGGETVVGKNSIIGGNVWLTESVPSFSVVYHKSETIIRNQNSFTEPINFII